MATASERRGIAGSLPVSDSVRLIQTGVGPLDSGPLGDRLRHACGVVSIGTCGGISPGAQPGMLILPTRISSPQHADFDVDAGWHERVYDTLKEKFAVDTDALVTVDSVLRHPEDKHRMHADTRAVAVDMESAQLAAVAAGIGIPFIALRVVLDAHDETLPASIASGVDRNGNTTPLRLLTALLGRPGDIVGLLRLAARLRTANTRLGRACSLSRDALLTPRLIG